MQITFNFPHVFTPAADSTENAEVLQATLEYWTKVNEIYLKRHPDTPTLDSMIKSGRVHYARTKDWDCIPGLYARGSGDCKTLAPAQAAFLRRAGIHCRIVFRWVVRNGRREFHILLQTPNGWRDPSKEAGMGAQENARY